MSSISVENLSKVYPGHADTPAVDGVTLDVPDGEFLVLLGPSGCGKTTTLRSVAGLEAPTNGSISLGNRCVFDTKRRVNVPPNKRNIGMVFQSYALWPNRTVRGNIEYPLKTRKVPGSKRDEMVRELADLVDCATLLDRYPNQLSGGQQQRVALARGLAGPPSVVLFDEPLSNLDARLRDVVRAQLHELHQRLNFTALYVTHDQSEALALGDRLAVMRQGRFEQIDTPRQLFTTPRTEYVAQFIGVENAFPLHRVDDRLFVADQDQGTRAPDCVGDAAPKTIRIRPEDVVLIPSGETVGETGVRIDGEVVVTQFGGRLMDIVVKTGDLRFVVRSSASSGSATSLRTGDRVTVMLPWDQCHVFDEAGERVTASSPSRIKVAS